MSLASHIQYTKRLLDRGMPVCEWTYRFFFKFFIFRVFVFIMYSLKNLENVCEYNAYWNLEQHKLWIHFRIKYLSIYELNICPYMNLSMFDSTAAQNYSLLLLFIRSAVLVKCPSHSSSNTVKQGWMAVVNFRPY